MRMLRNRAHPESNVFLCMMDKELVCRQMKHGVMKRVPEEGESVAWGEDELLKQERYDVELLSLHRNAVDIVTPEQRQQLHLMYMREDEQYLDLWSAFVNEFVPGMSQAQRDGLDITRSNEGVWEFTAVALEYLRAQWPYWARSNVSQSLKGLVRLWQGMVVRYQKVKIADVVFRVGDWVMPRPAPEDDLTPLPEAAFDSPKWGVPKRIWAGKIRRILSHSRYAQDSEPIEEKVLEVTWHESLDARHGGPYSVDLQAPIVLARESSECPYIPARSVLPIHFTPMRALHMPRGCPQCYVLIRRQWHSLGPGVNAPVPWPAL